MTLKSFKNFASKSTTNPSTSPTKMSPQSCCLKVTKNIKPSKRIPRLTFTFYVPKKLSKNLSLINNGKVGSCTTLAKEVQKRKYLTYPALSTTPSKFRVSEPNSSQEISSQNKLLSTKSTGGFTKKTKLRLKISSSNRFKSTSRMTPEFKPTITYKKLQIKNIQV